jgi:hypothetical protein
VRYEKNLICRGRDKTERRGRRSGEANERLETAATRLTEERRRRFSIGREEEGGEKSPTKMLFGRIRREEIFCGNG